MLYVIQTIVVCNTYPFKRNTNRHHNDVCIYMYNIERSYAVPAVGCRNCIIVPRSWPPCPRHGPGGSPPSEDDHSQQPGGGPWTPPIRDTAIHTISMLLQRRQLSQISRWNNICLSDVMYVYMYVCVCSGEFVCMNSGCASFYPESGRQHRDFLISQARSGRQVQYSSCYPDITDISFLWTFYLGSGRQSSQ